MIAKRFFRLFAFGVMLSGLLLPGLASAQQLGGDLLSPENKVKKIQGGFDFLEGPAADSAGNVYFTDLGKNRIYRWTLDNAVSVFKENSEGANGLYFDNDGVLLACLGAGRSIVSLSPNGEVTEIVSKYQGKLLNSPNDLWVDSDNGIYFTDPRYGKTDDEEQDGYHVYYIDRSRAAITRVIDDLVKPNGIIGTPDGRTLYVADRGGGKIYKYRITGPGAISGKTQFAGKGSDGMTLDEKGNLYITESSVFVYDSAGKLLGNISIPEQPANITFGGEDGKTLFITARTGFYSLDMKIRGAYRVTEPVFLENKPVGKSLEPGHPATSLKKNSIFFNFKRHFWNTLGRKAFD